MKINRLRDTIAGKRMDVEFAEPTSDQAPLSQLIQPPSQPMLRSIDADLDFNQNTRDVSAGRLTRYNKG